MMNPRNLLSLALLATLAAGNPRAADGKDAPALPAQPQPEQATGQSYDAIFSDILQSLPPEKRALVDSAQGAKRSAETAHPPALPDQAEAAREEARSRRSQALQSLPPEVKARVDKAILDLDNRRKEKQAEFKDLNR